MNDIDSLRALLSENPDIINRIKEPRVLLTLLREFPDLADSLTNEKIIALNRFIDPYSANVGPKSDEKLIFSVTNYTNEFYMRSHLLATQAYMYQAVEEHGLKDSDMFIKKQSNEELDAEREIIRGFLDNLFKYDPLKHLRDCYTIHSDKELTSKGRAKVPVELIKQLPPVELFTNYERFWEFYFDQIYALTNQIFGLSTTLEYAIRPYKIAKTDAEIDEFEREFADRLMVPFQAVSMNNWSNLGPWKNNKKNLKFHIREKDSRILDVNRMMRTPNSDKLKAQLIKHKVARLKKKQNLTKEDEAAIRTWGANMGNSDIVNEALANEGVDCPEDAIEYPVLVHDAATGETKDGKLFFKERVDRD